MQQAQLAQLDLARAEQAELAGELRSAQLRMDELQRHTRERHEQRDTALREAEQRVLALESKLNEAQIIERAGTSWSRTARRSHIFGKIGRRARRREGWDSRQSRRRSRLTSSHGRIQDELGRACAAMSGAVPPATPASRSVIDRVFGLRSAGRGIPFDRAWIERQVPDVGRISIGAFLKRPRFYRIDPHPLFASAYYLDRHSDIATAGISPLRHYLEHGWREGRDPHPYFANDWYLQQNPDVLRAGINPLVHYLEHGWKEGRRPNPVFDPQAYLAQNPDVEAAGLEPLSHFAAHGLDEHRAIPFLGLERDWRALVESSDAPSLMDYLLSDAVPTVGVQEFFDTDDEAWPPRPVDDFWIPQALRDFMIERGWDDVDPALHLLLLVMDTYAEAPDEFRDFNACRRILERVRELSRAASPSAWAVRRMFRSSSQCTTTSSTPCCASFRCSKQHQQNRSRSSSPTISRTTRPSSSISEIGGIVRHVRQAEESRFRRQLQHRGQASRGDKIVLLNNDTLVLPGWLENLVAPFDRFDKVGLVGSKLINWDGRLQEAGGIFGEDGSAWNFGRGQNISDPEYNYLKDVDYCSGASIAVSTELWRQLGGFDPDYAPAYCEDLRPRLQDQGSRLPDAV